MNLENFVTAITEIIIEWIHSPNNWFETVSDEEFQVFSVIQLNLIEISSHFADAFTDSDDSSSLLTIFFSWLSEWPLHLIELTRLIIDSINCQLERKDRISVSLFIFRLGVGWHSKFE